MLIQCRPRIFAFFKIPRFWQKKVGHGYLASKTWFLWNTTRFWQVLNLKIAIRCKPNISVLFKSPKILISKSRPWVLASRNTIPQDFWQVQNLRFRYDVSPISLYSLKVPRFWQAQVGHGFFCVKNMVLMKYPKILTGLLNLRFRYDVSPISLYSLKTPRFWKATQAVGFWCQKPGF